MDAEDILHTYKAFIIEETGQERVYWSVKSAVRDEFGTVVGMCGVSIDITA